MDIILCIQSYRGECYKTVLFSSYIDSEFPGASWLIWTRPSVTGLEQWCEPEGMSLYLSSDSLCLWSAHADAGHKSQPVLPLTGPPPHC